MNLGVFCSDRASIFRLFLKISFAGFSHTAPEKALISVETACLGDEGNCKSILMCSCAWEYVGVDFTWFILFAIWCWVGLFIKCLVFGLIGDSLIQLSKGKWGLAKHLLHYTRSFFLSHYSHSTLPFYFGVPYKIVFNWVNFLNISSLYNYIIC